MLRVAENSFPEHMKKDIHTVQFRRRNNNQLRLFKGLLITKISY